MTIDTNDFAELARREREQKAEDLALIERGMRRGDLSVVRYALDVGVTDAVPKILYRLWQEGAVSEEQLPNAIYDVWVHNKSPVRGLLEAGLGERAWLRMFKAAGFWWAVTEWVGKQPAYQHLTDRPAEPFTVWRGAHLSMGRGMSWTVHRDCAVDFADAWAAVYHSPTGVFRATLPARAALALFGDWREQEVVVNPNMLRGRIHLEETRQPPPLTEREIRLRQVLGLADDEEEKEL